MKNENAKKKKHVTIFQCTFYIYNDKKTYAGKQNILDSVCGFALMLHFSWFVPKGFSPSMSFYR